MFETAYAKINLALHVRKRREDGYHELETVYAFVDAGDIVSIAPAPRDELRVVGEFAAQLNDPFGNIVAKALAALPHGPGWQVTLDKRLPVAAGLGGGSADAGALFRLVQQQHGLPDDWQERAARLGADVPACVLSSSCVGEGIGTKLKSIDNDMAGVPVLLVNPRQPLATGAVFKAWDGIDRGGLPHGSAATIARQGRNDLETPAIALCPVIADVLAALGQSNAWLVRMSGSGATCFALYDDMEQMQQAATKIGQNQPNWWLMQGRLR